MGPGLYCKVDGCRSLWWGGWVQVYRVERVGACL